MPFIFLFVGKNQVRICIQDKQMSEDCKKRGAEFVGTTLLVGFNEPYQILAKRHGCSVIVREKVNA